MKTSDIRGILDFSSFRPEPDDPSAPWRKRFPGKRTALIGIGRAAISFRPVAKNGTPGIAEIYRGGEMKEMLSQIAPHIRAATDEGWCAVSLNTRYVISLETNLSRRPGSEEILKTNPRTILGGRYERGKRYAITHNPETNSSILLAMDEEHLKKVEMAFREIGLKLGRLCCGSYVLLRHALTVTNVTKAGEAPLSTFYVVCSEGAVCALVQDQDRWSEIRSRADVYEEDPGPVADLVAPFHSRLPPNIGITLVCDEPIEGLPERLSAALPGRPVTDLSQPGLLASLMIQN